MPTSKRTLTKWRKEALKAIEQQDPYNKSNVVNKPLIFVEIFNRILLLTQELLDQQLLKEK